MDWDYFICLFTQTHCTARGLRTKTIAAYEATLRQFRDWVLSGEESVSPFGVSTRRVLEYVNHLREDRNNGDSAVNRAVTILKGFYRAMVSFGHLDPRENPLARFPKMKQAPRKLPTVLSHEEVARLLDAPAKDTVLGLRDRAILVLIYGTGIRASECGSLREEDVDLANATIRVSGKGGHQRVLPLNSQVVEVLRVYCQARGEVKGSSSFFRSRSGQALSRGAIYERVRKYATQVKLAKRVSPHTLRHTFATHLVRADVNLVTIRDLLGHRQLTSTQVYLHVTAEELRAAATRHPVSRLAPTVEALLPNVRLPFQPPPARCRSG